MDLVRATLGSIGMGSFLLMMVMILWHFWRIARLGRADLLVNDFRFFDRRNHSPEVRTHVSAIWWWFAVGAISSILFGIGSRVI
jgi:hypothetical protein